MGGWGAEPDSRVSVWERALCSRPGGAPAGLPGADAVSGGGAGRTGHPERPGRRCFCRPRPSALLLSHTACSDPAMAVDNVRVGYFGKQVFPPPPHKKESERKIYGLELMKA